MDRFIDCLCNENYEALLASGKASKDQLLAAWLLILNEFHELKGNSANSNQVLELQIEITRLTNNLFLLQYCIDFLWDQYSESLTKSVNDLGYYFTPATRIPFEYRPMLNSVAQQAKTKYIEIQQINEKLKELVPNPEEKINPEAFEDKLLEFENMQRVSYSLETMTVAKFMSLDTKYKKLVDALEAKKAKNGY